MSNKTIDVETLRDWLDSGKPHSCGQLNVELPFPAAPNQYGAS